jgi:hypothetical protein
VTRDPSHDLIERLAGDLRPVRRLPPLAALLAGPLAAAAAVGALVLAVYHPRPELGSTLLHDPVYASVLLGLVLAGVGGCIAALASAVPGREAALRAAGATAAGGLLLAVAFAALGTPWAAEGSAEGTSGIGLRDTMCILRGSLFALLPAAVVLVSAARGWSGRPAATVAWGLLGAGAAGALFVHLTCPAVNPLHLLCTHTATPLLLAAALTAVLAPAMRRFAR